MARPSGANMPTRACWSAVGVLASLAAVLMFSIQQGPLISYSKVGPEPEESVDSSQVFGPRAVLLPALRAIGHIGFEASVAYSPDGAAVAVGRVSALSEDGERDRSYGAVVSLLDPSSGKERFTIEESLIGEGCSVAFSPDGRALAVGLLQAVKLYDPETGRERAEIACKEAGSICCLAFSADGRRLAAAMWGGEIVVWDVETRQRSASLQVPTRSVEAVALSPDGRWAASASQGPIVCRPIRRPFWPFGAGGLACVPDGGFVRLFDVDSGRETAKLKLEWRAYSVAFSPDGRLLAAGGGGVAVLWDRSANQDRTIVHAGSNLEVYAVAFSPDGGTLALGLGSRDIDGIEGEIRLWDTELDRARAILRGPAAGKIRSLAFAPDGRSLVTASPDSVVLWDVPPSTAPGSEVKADDRRNP